MVFGVFLNTERMKTEDFFFKKNSLQVSLMPRQFPNPLSFQEETLSCGKREL